MDSGEDLFERERKRTAEHLERLCALSLAWIRLKDAATTDDERAKCDEHIADLRPDLFLAAQRLQQIETARRNVSMEIH